MIVRILYRNNVHSVLNYVLSKAGNTILGFQNTYSDTDTNTKFFGRVLHYLGNRHDSEKRYVHATLNLPRGEQLDNADFFELSKTYMNHMGYGEQPYMVVRHHDTKHEHVHIVSTTIKEDCLQINLSHDFRRSMATQKYLEKQFGLSPSPEKRAERKLPLSANPQFRHKDIHGVRYYMQDIIHNTLQKYMVRGFDELANLLEKHHIQVKTVHHAGRVGVSYGIAIMEGYRSRFINGYTVHPQLSGPKLQQVFERNQSSKLLPMVKKRLEKQLLTTYKLFRTINPEHLPNILRSHQNLDCRLAYDAQGQVVDFSIYDKTGYVLKSVEIASGIGIRNNPDLFGTEYTQMYAESEQLLVELQRCIKEAFRNSYYQSGSKTLLSEHIQSRSIKPIVTEMARAERFLFLRKYLHINNGHLGNLIRAQFDIIKDKFYNTELIREERELQAKAGLIKQAIDQQLFDEPEQREVLFELIQSLGVKYDSGVLTYANSNLHKLKVDLGHRLLLTPRNSYIPPSFVRENEKLLEGLLNSTTAKEIRSGPIAIFLPLMFPKLYGAMNRPFMERFERWALNSYQKYAERMQGSFEKSPNDYIRFFNAKGFYFERREEKLFVGSMYSKYPVTAALPPKIQAYLISSSDLNKALDNQVKILDDIRMDGRDNLKSLWSGYLMEKGQYKKAAYMYVSERVRPNLPLEIVEHHMEHGFKEALVAVSKEQIDARRARLIKRGVFALGNLLGGKNAKEEEVFNGFKDELTDYSKYKSRGLSI
ncbi:relaxase/mobilization nuclease domain-containing protein [Arenibacter certesii]|uniref:MobA/VirD2-like nuclease domain-containing protein n=1 Tax=Arenibacter certesii TaxID=228955 RepID=A0A918MLF8_9FLAO|nr:relaxase/mobilization nuclease domain-containing protein [Arenibacter certesii]GGW35785.1 hypothetical protein GCM10007383_21040 [Arenibacter certesii]